MPSTSTFNKVDKVAMKGLDLLTETLAIGNTFSTEYSGEYAQQYAIGRTLRVPLSQRYITQRNDMTYNPQALDRPVTTITVDQTATIALEWESIEKALDMERGEERVTELYIKPAVAYIRQSIELYCAQFAATYANMIAGGALGTNPSTYDGTSAASLQALTEMGCPDNDLGLFLPPAVNRAVKTAAIGYFNPTVDLSKQFRDGYVGRTDSFDWYGTNSLYRLTTGIIQTASALKISGGGQSGSSLLLACTSGDTFKAGDKFAIAAVNQVNLMTRQATSTSTAGTKVFSITADTTASSTTVTVPIYPPIYGPGSHYQNVDALPGANAVVTMWPGTTFTASTAKTGYVGLGIHPGAFFLVGMKLEEPEAVEICRQYQDPKTGIALRFIRQWDNVYSRMTNRLDCLWGCGVGLAEQCAVVIPCA